MCSHTDVIRRTASKNGWGNAQASIQVDLKFWMRMCTVCRKATPRTYSRKRGIVVGMPGDDELHCSQTGSPRTLGELEVGAMVVESSTNSNDATDIVDC